MCRAPIENFDEIKAMMEGGDWEYSDANSKNSKKSDNQKSRMS